MVYIREAHPTDGWQVGANQREGVLFEQPTSLAGRSKIAKTMCAKLKIKLPALVDDLDDKVNKAYFETWAAVDSVCNHTSNKFPELSFALKTEESTYGAEVKTTAHSNWYATSDVTYKTKETPYIEIDSAVTTAGDIENQVANAFLNGPSSPYVDQPVKKSKGPEKAGKGSNGEQTLSSRLRELEEIKDNLSEEEYNNMRKTILESFTK